MAGTPSVPMQGASVRTGSSWPSTLRDSRQFCRCLITPDCESESSGTLTEKTQHRLHGVKESVMLDRLSVEYNQNDTCISSRTTFTLCVFCTFNKPARMFASLNSLLQKVPSQSSSSFDKLSPSFLLNSRPRAINSGLSPVALIQSAISLCFNNPLKVILRFKGQVCLPLRASQLIPFWGINTSLQCINGCLSVCECVCDRERERGGVTEDAYVSYRCVCVHVCMICRYMT